MPTIEQIRAARALIGWNQGDLADRANLSQTGIARIENGTNKPNTQTLAKIRAAFDRADVEFIDTTGVKKKENNVQIFEGTSGFVEFLNDVHHVVQAESDTSSIYVNNVSEDDFLKWEGDFASVHERRMHESDVSYKIITKEGDDNFTASDYAEYRWVSEDRFSNVSYYIYHDRSALIDFSDNNVHVYLIRNQAIANFYRHEFERIWGKAKLPS